MIIVLKGADFSANNIGKVQVTTDLHPYTKAAIDASGNTSLTGEQKSALNELFLAMGVDGSNDAMSKMRRVYLPIIAGDVSKALVNYNTTDMIVDKELSEEYWTLRSNGLVGVKTGQSIELTENNILKADNFSSFLLRTEKMEAGINDSSYVITLRGKTNTDLFLGLRQSSVSGNNSFNFGEYGAGWEGFTEKSKDKIKASCVVNSKTGFANNVQGLWTLKDSPKPTTSDMSGETSQTCYVFGLSTVQTTKPYAVAMIGEAIDTEIAKNICAKIDALYETFI